MKDTELINECKATGRALNYEVQSAVDIGAGEIDVIWTRKDHANLPTFKLGFFFCPMGEVPTDFLTQSVAKALLSVCDKAIFLVHEVGEGQDSRARFNRWRAAAQEICPRDYLR